VEARAEKAEGLKALGAIVSHRDERLRKLENVDELF
jgi:hypothetical protein